MCGLIGSALNNLCSFLSPELLYSGKSWPSARLHLRMFVTGVCTRKMVVDLMVKPVFSTVEKLWHHQFL